MCSSTALKVFITGASSGIGSGAAGAHYAAQGAILGLVARGSAANCQALAE